MPPTIELDLGAGVATAVDSTTGRLRFPADVAVEELAMRGLDAARAAYAAPPRAAEPLYHMANGITPTGRAEPESELRLELTSLRPGVIGGEWVKTVGHVHSTAPDGVGYPEAYEVVSGEATFVLFRPAAACCLLVDAEEGDLFVIPPDWYHLAVNRGHGPMVFADVVARAVVPDYALLRERRGGPVYLGPDGIHPNPRHPASTAIRVRPSELPGVADHGALAETFLLERPRLRYLVEPRGYRKRWDAFEAYVLHLAGTASGRLRLDADGQRH